MAGGDAGLGNQGTRREPDTKTFIPRPEAKAYRWNELTRSNKRATRELLRWLQTATGHTADKDDDMATSVLIAGDRGTGKTTVLLTAAQAVRDKEKEEKERFEREIPEDEGGQTIREGLSDIRNHVEWLDRLDLEPIPRTANLLTTLLVCVRAALEKAYGLKASEEKVPCSLLDEGDESPWDAIDQLIRDATYMWEEMQAPDLERRVTQQTKAAETYAAFQERLKDALDKVIKALRTRRFGQGGKDPLIMVLPIDNVDRSVDHIASIRKLLRMVPGRRLWFVLAAGGGDFQLFLERAFFTELNRDEKVVMSGQSWEDARTIARRQAAGAMREVIPPIHRIDLDPVYPEEAWGWGMPESGDAKSQDAKSPLTLGELLEKIRFRVKRAEESTTKPPDEGIQFSRLFVLNTWFSQKAVEAIGEIMERQRSEGVSASELPAAPGTQKPPPPPIFSDAGRKALTLPIRRLLDLYLLLRRCLPTNEAGVDLQEIDPAVQVAEKMLRNCIDESDLSDRISRLLREEIIAKDANGRTALHNLTGEVAWSRPTSPFAEFTRHHPNPEVSRTTIRLRWPGELRLCITDPEDRGKGHPLPSSVAGWYMVLHDLLKFAPEPRVYASDRQPGSQPLVETRHTIESAYRPAEIALPWPEPEWSSFLERSIAASQWRGRLHKIESVFSSCDSRGKQLERNFERVARLLRAAWAANIYEVTMYVQATKPGGTNSEDDWPTGIDEKAVLAFEKWIRENIVHLHNQCHDRASDVEERELFSFTEDRFSRTHTWIDTCLPMLFRGEFVPALVGKDSISRVDGDSETKTLGRHWRDRADFLSGRLATAVIDAVQGSDTYKGLKGDLGAADLWDWLGSACRACFGIGSKFRRDGSETFMPNLHPESRWPPPRK